MRRESARSDGVWPRRGGRPTWAGSRPLLATGYGRGEGGAQHGRARARADEERARVRVLESPNRAQPCTLRAPRHKAQPRVEARVIEERRDGRRVRAVTAVCDDVDIVPVKPRGCRENLRQSEV